MIHVLPDGDTGMTVWLPWPPRALHPNARVHHMAKARAVKKARADAAWLATGAGLTLMRAEVLDVSITFHAPDNRRRDVDGMLSSLKPALDGLADVIGVDDSNWSISIRKAEPRKPGAVRIEIKEIPQ